MKDCIWCHGENIDGSEWGTCSLTSPYTPEVLVTDYVCPGCYKKNPEVYRGLQDTMEDACMGAGMALEALDARKEDIELVRGEMLEYLHRLVEYHPCP